MLVFNTPADMYAWSMALQRTNLSVGFVPTMGALHEGHLQLLRQSKSENDTTVLSIYVNPTQFNNASDYDKYPRTFDSDIELARSVGVDVVYAPQTSVMYPIGFDTSIDPGNIARSMEGEFRPGHFQGVATVVIKLLQAVVPEKLYLGQKDYQQLAVLRHVITDLNVPVSVIGVPTVRHHDGLAMSSRNVRLSVEHRQLAPVLYSALSICKEMFQQGERNVPTLRDSVLKHIHTVQSCSVEYVSVVDAVTLQETNVVSGDMVVCLAVNFGDVRLIDNIILEVEKN